jgi:Tfp pilus assembly protein FimT
MLVVIAIAMILAVISLIAFRTITSSSALTTSINLVGNAFAYARQEAIAKNTLTSVVILTQASAPNTYATFSVWEYSSSAGTWSQITTWKTLPPGIVFDNGTSAANSPTISYLGSSLSVASSYISTAQSATPFVSNPSSATASAASIPYYVLGTTATLTYGTAGSPTSQGYACQTFLPSGRLYSAASSPYSLLLVEGLYTYSGGALTLTYTHINTTTSGPANYAWFFFNLYDGQAKIIRP